MPIPIVAALVGVFPCGLGFMWLMVRAGKKGEANKQTKASETQSANIGFPPVIIPIAALVLLVGIYAIVTITTRGK